MSDLLSYQLFGHCALGLDSTHCDTPEISSILSDEASLSLAVCNSFTESLEVENALASVESLNQCDTLDMAIELFSVGINDTESGDLQHHDDWGFMLSDSGGMISFDDDHGAVDWGFDDAGISANADF